VIVRSGWQGSIELNGKIYQFTVVDNMDGIIGRGDIFFLRTEQDRERKFKSNPFFERLPASQNLCCNGHEYDLEFNFETGETGSALSVTFTEPDIPLAELEIDGHNIKRLILKRKKKNGDHLVIYDTPGSRVLIPEGLYDRQSVFMDGGDSLGLFSAHCTKRISVRQGELSTVKIGGPLYNRVNVKRRGLSLELSYELTGAGGEHYSQESIYRKNPTFTVYQGNTIISRSHAFRFG